jgi:hypothetical protein
MRVEAEAHLGAAYDHDVLRLLLMQLEGFLKMPPKSFEGVRLPTEHIRDSPKYIFLRDCF